MKKIDGFTIADNALIKRISDFRYHPLEYVIFAYPWEKKGSPFEHWKIEDWQYRSLKAFGEKIRKRGVFTGKESVMPIFDGAVTGHGTGKTALIGMKLSWIMSTRPHCKGTVTAGTIKQLETKTWPEIVKWMKYSITGHWFEYQHAKVQCYAEEYYPTDNWRFDMISSKEENYESFAGQHARDSSSFYVFDESSKIPDKIFEVADMGITDGEPFWLQYGNCNRNKGRFYDSAFGKRSKRWDMIHLDSREVTITNKEHIKEAIQEYGEESDWVRVRVRGLYPKREENQYIGYDLVEVAQNRNLEQHEFHLEPRVLGVDPAGDGEDEHVIVLRQGYNSWVLGAWKHISYETMGLASIVADLEDKWDTSATFIDKHGVGLGTINRLQQLGRKPIMVNSQSTDVKSPLEFQNKKDEMWSDMRKWLYEGGSIPVKDSILEHDLTAPLSIFDDRFTKVESKKAMRARGESSPGRADALAYTFYAPVRSTARMEHYYRVTGNLDKINRFNKEKTKHEYDPWSRS